MRLVYLMLIFTCISCSQGVVSENTKVKKIEVKKDQVPVKYDLSNPALYMGSSFGEYIQSLYILGEFDKIINLISSKDKISFTEEELKELIEENIFLIKLS